jgi:PAS domain S-box-containing protein
MSDLLSLLFIGINEEDRLTFLYFLSTHYTTQADTTPSGASASALLQSRQYQVIVAAANLPDGSGLDWLQAIRAQGFTSPVLLLSPQQEEALVRACLLQEAADYLCLPLLSSELVTRSIRHLLREHQLLHDRRVSQTKLGLNQDRLKEAYQMAHLGNWEVNLETRAVTCSDEVYQIFDFDPGQKPDFDTLISRIHPQDRIYRRSLVEEALQKNQKYQVEYRILLPGNRVKHISVHGYPVLNAAGKAVGLNGTVQDISDRISTQIALKASEKRYLMLLETMTEGVLHADKDHTIIYANKSFCEMMGYDKMEVIGQPFFRFAPDASTIDLLKQKNLLRLQHITDQYEIQLKKKDGSLVYFLIGASPLQNEHGEVTGSLGTFTDITERKNMEEALKSSEKRFRTLFEDAQGFLCTHALDGTILSINKAAADMVGLKPAALQQTNFRQMLAADADAEFDQYLRTTGQQKQATGIFRVVNQSRNTFHYLVYRNILYQETGKEPYVIVSAQDITDRISMEEQLRQAKTVAENSVKVKEQFLANISHEIRTPMNAIIGLTGVLQKMMVEEEEKSYLEAIQSSADKLLIIINDILDFSKIEAGKIEFERTVFNPRRVLQESLHLFEATASESNNRLKVIIDTEVPELVIGDPGKLSQILNNLLSNAIKFTHNGLIRVFLEMVTQQEDTCQLEFQVHDTGIGIPEEKLQTVFESFTQGSSDTTRKYGGTGLGLTITKKLIELQGGTISVTSQPNQGSTFSFTLSYKKRPEQGQSPPLPTELPLVNPQDLGHLKILLAEDNTINQVLIKKVVTDWGYELHTAANGLQALALFRQNRYDVILMDMQMPEMDGYETMAVIRQSPAPESATPIIALTAHASKQEAEKCLQAGADLYVSKPFKPEKLLADIAGLLQKKPALNLPALAAPAPEKKYINLAYLQELAEGDMDFVADILSMFMEQTPENIRNLQQLAAAHSWQQVKALAHKMKSSVVMIGNKQLEEIFTNLQLEALSDQAAVKIPPLIDQATEICAGAIAAIKAELQTLN